VLVLLAVCDSPVLALVGNAVFVALQKVPFFTTTADPGCPARTVCTVDRGTGITHLVLIQKIASIASLARLSRRAAGLAVSNKTARKAIPAGIREISWVTGETCPLLCRHGGAVLNSD